MILSENSLVAWWKLDSSLQMWPEFDENAHGYEYFKDSSHLSQAVSLIRNEVSLGRYPNEEEAFKAFCRGEFKLEIPHEESLFGESPMEASVRAPVGAPVGEIHEQLKTPSRSLNKSLYRNL